MKSYLEHSVSIPKRFSTKILVGLASIYGFRLFPTDITQSYLQSDEELKGDIYMKPPQELNLDQDLLQKLHGPLFRLSKSWDYWSRTFRRWLEIDLKMSSFISDPTLLKRGENYLHGLCATYEGDTLHAKTEKYSYECNRTQQLFKRKSREWDNTQFPGLKIEKRGHRFLVHQWYYIRKLTLQPKQGYFTSFGSLKAKLTNNNKSFQLGHIIVLVDKTNMFQPILWHSCKSKISGRSVVKIKRGHLQTLLTLLFLKQMT